MPEGCDVSEHQGVLPASFFAAYDFVILRAFNENGIADRVFAQNWQTARGQTLRGAYGWPIPGADNHALGAQLVAVAPDAEAGYWADVERSARGLASAADTEAYLRGIGDRARGFYSNSNECPRSPFLDNENFWLADYGPNDGRRHDPLEQPPYPPRPYAIHQYTSNPIDKNYADAIPGDDVALSDDDKLFITVTVANLLGLGNWVHGETTAGPKNVDGSAPSIGQVVGDVSTLTALVKAIAPGGLSADQVREIVRTELDKTRLAH